MGTDLPFVFLEEYFMAFARCSVPSEEMRVPPLAHPFLHLLKSKSGLNSGVVNSDCRVLWFWYR